MYPRPAKEASSDCTPKAPTRFILTMCLAIWTPLGTSWPSQHLKTSKFVLKVSKFDVCCKHCFEQTMFLPPKPNNVKDCILPSRMYCTCPCTCLHKARQMPQHSANTRQKKDRGVNTVASGMLHLVVAAGFVRRFVLRGGCASTTVAHRPDWFSALTFANMPMETSFTRGLISTAAKKLFHRLHQQSPEPNGTCQTQEAP